MSKLSAPELGSYAGGATAIGASLTLTEIGVIVGIITALLTFAINAIYTYRRDRREQRETDARLGVGK
ncbi:phage holin family protein [Massilia oculi]|uniref:Phage holin family protein n=1 Tax=Massilia hydrophila TaxID=3044279 RepID=A0ABS7YCN3_9BURK|nr:HP1 family phage holin [Massilia oculi]MCA1857462.1 phage holin family protein [Massilia oculi]